MTAVRVLEFDILGEPVPQGSFVAFADKRTGRARLKPSNEPQLKKWRRTIATVVRADLECHPHPQIDEPVALRLFFRFPATASDPYRYHHAVRPDIDKLARAVFDALTEDAELLVDDGRVCRLEASATFATPGQDCGVHIEIRPLGADESVMREQRKTRAALARRGPVHEHQAALL